MNVEKSLDLYKKVAEVPVFTSASFLPSVPVEGDDGNVLLHIRTTSTVRNHSQFKKQRTAQTFTVLESKSATTTLASSPPTETSPLTVHESLSPSGQRLAIQKSDKSAERNGAKRVVEVWDVGSSRLEAYVEVGDVHGDFRSDETFGSLTWNGTETAIVYVAEEKEPSDSKKEDGEPGSVSRPSYEKFKYVPDFGEKLVGIKKPALFYLDISPTPTPSEEAQKQDAPSRKPIQLTSYAKSPETSFGQPVFGPPKGGAGENRTERIYTTGYSSLPDGRKLGVIYCTNRPSRIYEIQFEVPSAASSSSLLDADSVSVKPISDPKRSSRSPRVWSDQTSKGNKSILVYLSNAEEGPHNSCASLHRRYLSSSSSGDEIAADSDDVIVHTVNSPKEVDDFPGLYLNSLPALPFLNINDRVHLILSSIWRSREVPILVGLSDGSITRLDETDNPETKLDSYSVFGTDGKGRVLVSRSYLNKFPELVLGSVIPSGAGKVVANWTTIKSRKALGEAQNLLSSLSAAYFTLPPSTSTKTPPPPTEILFLTPHSLPSDLETDHRSALVGFTTGRKPEPGRDGKREGSEKKGLITIPHGGPHGCFTTSFSPQYSALACIGYEILIVNYPGSLGFGQDSVLSLPPVVSELDVLSTLSSTKYIRDNGLSSGGDSLLMGGSHGGFIAAHLSGRFPKEYAKVVMRNPVIDLTSNFSMSDIPDWNFAEVDVPYPFSRPPTTLSSTTFETLLSKSPIIHVQNVTSPTLLLLGEVDRRVPPAQGKAWYASLRAKGDVDVECLVFPGESHPLDGVEAEVKGLEANLRWFAKN